MHNQDVLGGHFGRDYSLILTDPGFENRLQAFDPNLKLMFDQRIKKWRILELAPDNSGWNIILTAENPETKEAVPLGEWVFRTLKAFRDRYEHRRKNPTKFLDDLIYQANQQQAEIEAKGSEEHKYKLLDERNEWRRAARELRNGSKSDVTAGYPKITPKPKGKIICQP